MSEDSTANIFDTQDMAFASFLVMQGCVIAQVRRSGRRVIWAFAVPVDVLRKLEAEWPGSDAARFFNTYQTLKGQIRHT